MKIVPRHKMRTGDTFCADDMNRYEESLREMIDRSRDMRFIQSFFVVSLDGWAAGSSSTVRRRFVYADLNYTVVRIDVHLVCAASTHTITIDDNTTSPVLETVTVASTGTGDWVTASVDTNVFVAASKDLKIAWSATGGVTVTKGHVVVHVVADRLTADGADYTIPSASNFKTNDVPSGDTYADTLTDWEQTATLDAAKEQGACICMIPFTPSREPVATREGLTYFQDVGMGFFRIAHEIVADTGSGVVTVALRSPGPVTEASDSNTPTTSTTVADTVDLYTSDTVVQPNIDPQDSNDDWTVLASRATPGTAPQAYSVVLTTF